MLLLDRFLKHFPLSIALVTQLYQLVDGYGFHAPLDDLTSGVSPPLRALSKRDGPELCSSSSPCRDKSCCGPQGHCGYGPSYCGVGCISNCDAQAMCGNYSAGGTRKCGMNLCCSVYGWCGTEAAHCNVDPTGLTGCQQGFGSCQIYPYPSCSSTGGSSAGRTIGYYQGSNVRDRPCNRISPSQINTSGYTHLNYAFAWIDPATFHVVPVNAADTALYTQFTALKTSSMQTWIAIGGWEFSDPGPTHTTWSNMTSNSANRAAFISSLVSFMSQYGFQGADLDWEYPAAYDRGGSYADTANYVSLVKEMRAAFGTKYGISLTLAPDPGAVNGFDAISMQPYVDFFGFMSYDLHGSWDSNNAAGTVVRGQTDAREIRNDSLALWFDTLNPAKINFGLAYYGRGYTLASSSCATLGCAFTGPSNAAPCTNQVGVMSLVEIQALIQQKNLVPQLLSDAMMKQITWDDQWIGYDDADTFALKKAFANSLCFGGTMAWSVDFNSGTGSGSTPDANLPVTTDGTCGASKTICGNWASGNCGSASGYCGSTSAYCGNGCQSGNCTVGGVTTDGTCGVAHRNSTCGSWSAGSCCSSAGYCGNTAAHCGTGCQSGCDNTTASSGGGSGSGNGSDGGSGTVYIDPSIWQTANPVVQCEPPCELVLPPFILSSAKTITWPPFTTSVLSSSNGVIVTKTTMFTIPVFSTSEIGFWPVLVGSTDPTVATFTAEQSVMPPSFTVTLPGTEASIQVTEPNTSATSTTLVPPVFFGSSHGVIFQPQPTVSISIPPPPGGPSPITYSKGPPKPTCVSGCGVVNCDFGCPGPHGHPCGVLGCGGGCGLIGCGQGCTLFGCRPGLGGSGNPGNPGNPGSPDCQGSDCPSTTTTCTNPKTIGTTCSVVCPQTVVPSLTTVTGSCTTTCSSTSRCGATDFTTTSTSAKTITYPASDTGIADPAYTFDLGSPEATSVYQQMQNYLAAEDIAAAADSVVAGSDASASSGAGANDAHPATITTTSQSTVTTHALPTMTTNSPVLYCFDQDKSGTYVPFNEAPAGNVIAALCGRKNTLAPGNTYGYVEQYTDPSGFTVTGHARWAADQTNCEPEADIPMSGTSCIYAMNLCTLCNNQSRTANWGAAYVDSTPYGCVEWSLYAKKS